MLRLIALSVLIPALFLVVVDAKAQATAHKKTRPAVCKTRECAIRVARKKCSQRKPIPCIKRAALHYRVAFTMLVRKARCETAGTFNPYAVLGRPFNPRPISVGSGTPVGLFQFKPGTFWTTPYARRSPWRAKWASLAAGWMHRVGRGGEWECQ